MDELRGGRRKQPKTAQCMPRLRRSRGAATPTSLLERFREAVFKLIMISAFTKRSRSTASRSAATSASSSTHRSPAGGGSRHHDSYRSEAVEDCIEFFKRSAEGAKSYGVSEDALEVAGYCTAFPVM